MKFFSPHSSSCKSIVILLVISYLLIIFNVALSRFTSTDIVPELKPLNTDAIKKLGPFAVNVQTGLFIKNFPMFENTKNNFLVDAVVWFEFNADEMMLDIIEKFSFDMGRIIQKTPVDTKINDRRIFAKYNVIFELKTDLQFHKFPFQDHRLVIMLSNDFVAPEEMYFIVDASSFQMLPNIIPSSWMLKDLRVDTGFQPMQFDQQDTRKKAENPKAMFVVTFLKTTAKNAMVIFIPLFSASMLSLFSFVLNIANVVGKFTLAASAVTALLGYRFVIEQMIPRVGYMTTTDEIYLILLIFAFICFSIQLLLTRSFMTFFSDNKKEKSDHDWLLERYNTYLFFIMILLLVVLSTISILR